MANKYQVGTAPTFTGTFKNIDGVLTDPTTVTIRMRRTHPLNPVWTKTYPADPEVVQESTGVFTFTFTLTLAGEWYYAFIGAGALVAAGEKRIDVEEPNILG